jgi:hypothetical protein
LFNLFIHSNWLLLVHKAHLLSIFDNTKTVKFDEKNYDKILECISQEGEMIPLTEPVIAQVSFFFSATA